MDLQDWLSHKRYLTEGVRRITTPAGEGILVDGILSTKQEQALIAASLRPPSGSIVLKFGSRSFVGAAPIADSRLALKYYSRLSLRRQLGYTLMGTRAMRSWIAARTFVKLGLPTPEPIALVESQRFGFIKDRSLFVTRMAEGVSLREFAKQHASDTQALEKLATEARRIFQTFAEFRIYHGDTNTKNFIVTPDGQLSIIDLDACEFLVPENQWQKKRRSDERKFSRLWQDSPELAEIFKDVFKP